jgi:GH15 family glucan-1,4-alpha-glucosidase
MRIDGYAPIEDYAVIGDGRTVALVARDGAIDWLCLPNIDSPSVFAAVLDAARGGAFELQPVEPFTSSRRYLPDTNVLETTFRTSSGVARVVDALTLPDDQLAPMRELVRVVEGVSGTVRMRWRVAPRFAYGSAAPRFESRVGVPVATYASEAVAVCHWTGGAAAVGAAAVEGTFESREGARATLVLASAYGEPLIIPSRAKAEERLDKTIRFWREWIGSRSYRGGWAEAVRRSALALKLLIFAPSGATVAAPTTSLPEAVGGGRNWDYRFCWIRDSNFMIDALLSLGCSGEAQSLFWWFMQATALTEPNLDVLYRLDGGSGVPERTLPLDGYRRSRPVRVGNAAVNQRQLDIYGALFETAWLYSEGHHRLDHDTGVVLGRIADRVARIWRLPDAGIWEVRNGPFQFTHSKVMCWVALDRAVRLAGRGELPRRHAERWRREADAIAAFVDERCWSARLHSYTRVAHGDRGGDAHADVDASLLMLPLVGYGDPKGDRINGTIDAVSRELRDGDFVYRYHADDGLSGAEGCFLNGSFWLVGALARAGRLREARPLMDSLVRRANDVGLYSEEVDPRTGAFLGNFPQALVHLALIDAAVAISLAES